MRISYDNESGRRYRRRVTQRRFERIKKRSVVVVTVVVTFVVLFLVGIWQERFRVSFVVIEGVDTLATTTITALVHRQLSGTYSFIFPRDSLFIYPRADISQTLVNAYPRVKEVSTRTRDVRTLVVSIIERKPHARWCSQTGPATTTPECYLMDNDGYLFDTYSSDDVDILFTFRGAISETTHVAGDTLGKQFPARHINVLRGLHERLSFAGIAVNELSVLPEGDYMLTTTVGVDILFSRDADTANVIEKLSAALKIDGLKERLDAGTLEYLDLRFAGKVFYK